MGHSLYGQQRSKEAFMNARRIPFLIPLLFIVLQIFPLALVAQAAEAPADSSAASAESGAMPSPSAEKPFGFGINLGIDMLPVPGGLPGQVDSYQRFGFTPELRFGKFGIGLDLTLRAKIALGTDDPFVVYYPDWVPDYADNGTNFLDVYLPKFLFVRYGSRGDDIYIKLGSIDDLTLGNGFIMGNYSNTRFLPERRIFGLGAGLDGNLFKFPYVGAEFTAGNVARFDVFGGRLYTRPLAWLSVPIIKGLEIGGEAAFDRDPYLYQPDDRPASGASTLVWGIDTRMPIIAGELFPLVAYADLAFQPNGRVGQMTGVSGRLLGIIMYSAQIRFLKDGFIPDLFDSNYDLYRADRYATLQTVSDSGVIAGWYLNAGASLLKDKVAFGALMEGPFAALPATRTENSGQYPRLRAVVTTAEGLLGGFSVNASYDKYFLGRDAGFWKDLVTAKNAQIQAGLSYKTGAAVISLIYNLRYDPNEDTYDVSSSLQTAISY
jgi:hypothetical protein